METDLETWSGKTRGAGWLRVEREKEIGESGGFIPLRMFLF